MMRRATSKRIAVAVGACFAVSACQTVKMPKIDIMKSPEFAEDAANISKSYPSVKDAPLAPTDVRSDAQWDVDARALQALRNAAPPVDDEPGLTEGEAEAQYEDLKAKAQAYKKDDPANGPVQGFPEYEPRR